VTELLRRWLAVGVVLAIAVGIVAAIWLAAFVTGPRPPG
jgi:predicted outer membrane lipoprotein